MVQEKALRHTRLRPVAPVDHTAVLRLLADRHHDLTGLRTQAICRLHALRCCSASLSAERAGQILPTARPAIPVEVERKRIVLDLLGDVEVGPGRQTGRPVSSVTGRAPWSRLFGEATLGPRQRRDARHPGEASTRPRTPS